MAAGKFGKFGESSVIRQTLTSQILASNNTLWPKSLSIRQTLFHTFNSVTCQTFTPPNILAIRYSIPALLPIQHLECWCHFVLACQILCKQSWSLMLQIYFFKILLKSLAIILGRCYRANMHLHCH